MTEKDTEIPNIDLILLSNFTHQIINPLNGVAGTLSNLLDKTITGNRIYQRINSSRSQIEQVISLVRNLAYLASFNNEPDINNRIIVIPQAIIEAAMFYQEQGSMKNISIDLINKTDQNRISGHPEILKQILMNIFDNAIKYSKENTRVIVDQRIRNKDNKAIISITSTPKKSLTNIEIEKVFDLGFRGENARSIIASGTGLGLYICRFLVQKYMNGSISLQNDKDGLVFIIQIPVGM